MHKLGYTGNSSYIYQYVLFYANSQMLKLQYFNIFSILFWDTYAEAIMKNQVSIERSFKVVFQIRRIFKASWTLLWRREKNGTWKWKKCAKIFLIFHIFAVGNIHYYYLPVYGGIPELSNDTKFVELDLLEVEIWAEQDMRGSLNFRVVCKFLQSSFYWGEIVELILWEKYLYLFINN